MSRDTQWAPKHDVGSAARQSSTETLQLVNRRGYRILNQGDFASIKSDMSKYEKDEGYIVAITLAGEQGSQYRGYRDSLSQPLVSASSCSEI